MNRIRILAAFGLLTLLLAPSLSHAQLPRDAALESAVRTWYLQYFNREVDPPSLNHWVGIIRGGMPMEETQARLLGSVEYFENHGNRPKRFIRGMYEDVLGYDPRPEELDFWVNRMAELAPSRDERFLVSLEFLQFVRGTTEQQGGFGQQFEQPPPEQAAPFEPFGCQARQENGGVRLFGIREGTTAAQIGLQNGDLISTCDGHSVRSVEEFKKVVSTQSVHQFGMVRGDLPASATVQTVARKVVVKQSVQTVQRVEQRPIDLPELGCAVRADDAGLRIRATQADSVATKLGLRPGDLLLGVDGRPVQSVEEFRRVFRSSEQHSLNLERGGQGYSAQVSQSSKTVTVRESAKVIRREQQVVDMPDLGCKVRLEDNGLRVQGLRAGAMASQMGLQEGDLIGFVDGRPVRSVEQFRALTVQQRFKESVKMEVKRGSEVYRGAVGTGDRFRGMGRFKKSRDDDDDD